MIADADFARWKSAWSILLNITYKAAGGDTVYIDNLCISALDVKMKKQKKK